LADDRNQHNPNGTWKRCLSGRSRLATCISVLILLLVSILTPAHSLAEAPAKPAEGPKAAPQPTRKQEGKKTLIVFDITPEKGVEKSDANLLTELVIDRISKLKRYSVIGQKDLDKMLSWEQGKQLKGCTDTACLVQIAGALGAEFYVEGSVGSYGSQYIITLKLMDAYNVRVIERSTEKVKKDEDAVVRAIEQMVDTICKTGIALLPPVHTDEIKAGKPVEKKSSPLILPGQITLFSGVGVVALGGVFTYLASKEADDYKKGSSPEKMRDAENWRKNYNGLAIGFYALGGAAVVTGTVLWVVGALEKKKPTALIVPVVDRDGAYLSAAWEW
jgi:TolB-like protein